MFVQFYCVTRLLVCIFRHSNCTRRLAATTTTMPCKCGATTGCVTSRCECHKAGKGCGADCSCTAEYCKNRRPAAAAAAAAAAAPAAAAAVAAAAAAAAAAESTTKRRTGGGGGAKDGGGGGAAGGGGGGAKAGGGGGGGAKGGSDGDSSDDDDDDSKGGWKLRGGVSHLEDDVWRDRGMDLYTRKKVKPGVPNVDHIIEVQVFETVSRRLPPAYSTRSATAAVSAATAAIKTGANGLSNLNVTSRVINQAKKGPFMRFLHRLPDGGGGERTLRLISLGEHARASCRELVDDGTWARIEHAAADAHDALVATWSRDDGATAAQAAYLTELADLIDKMDLEPRAR